MLIMIKIRKHKLLLLKLCGVIIAVVATKLKLAKS